MKLYKVKLRGMKTIICGNIAYGDSYVLAENTDEAYKKVLEFLEHENLGFKSDRELESVTLLADESKYNYIGRMVFI